MSSADELDSLRVPSNPATQDHWNKSRVQSRVAKPAAAHSNQPVPMELGAVSQRRGNQQPARKPLTEKEKEALRKRNGCFYCRKPNAGHMSFDCPLKKAASNSRA